MKCIRGATVIDIHDDLTKRNISVNTLSIVVGTNDCANRTSEDEILSDYRRLLELATQRANKVVVSSIPPVMNAAARQELTDSVNARLTDVCKETGAVMICHDPNFRLANYAANGLLLHKDGIHLSEAGTHRLLQNLDVASEHSIASDDRKSTHEHTHRHAKDIQNKRDVSRGGWNTVKGNKSRDQPQHQRGLQHQRGHRNRQSGRQNQHQHRPSARGGDQPRCFQCGESGHMRDSCRHTRPVKCFDCGNFGHKAENCMV